jgi:hypothetical protein
MPYRAWANGDIPSGADFNNMFADGKVADVATGQGTASTAYTDLATSGPAQTESLVAGQGILVIIGSRGSNTLGGASGQAYTGFAVSGASTLAASDTNAIETDQPSSPAASMFTSKPSWYVATNTGSHTFTMKYKAGTGGTANFADRRIFIKKF